MANTPKTPQAPPLMVNGWTILLHPLFLDQVAAVTAQVERARARDPNTYKSKNAAKRLAAILKLAFETIPQDPGADIYRQGHTLGSAYAHWRRAKFFQQCRLFFRYDQTAKIIIYAWCNDETTKRAYGSKTDAYTVFAGMLAKANPPNSWASLKQACVAEEARRQSAGEPSGAADVRKMP